MKIVVCTCTYHRPVSLGYVIRCFERQTHADRAMVILDDAGELAPASGPGWQIAAAEKRYPTLGAKRNALAALAAELHPDAEAFAIWDDDDLYLPWALRASAAALVKGDWSRPSLVLLPHVGADGRWTFRQHQTHGPPDNSCLYHGGWVYRRSLFESTEGYTAESGPEDQGLMRRMEALSPRIVDPIALGFPPAYIYAGSVCSGRPSLSRLGCNQAAYELLGEIAAIPAVPNSVAVNVCDPPWFDLDFPTIETGTQPRPF